MAVIDLSGALPNDESGRTRQFHRETLVIPGGQGPGRLRRDPSYGFGNYDRIFTSEQSTLQQSPTKGKSVADMVAEMDEVGIERRLILTYDNTLTASIVRQYPDRFLGFAYVNPFDGMIGVRELQRLVVEEGLSGLEVDSLYSLLPASDRRYYPLYAKCVELDVPVRIYAAMTYANDRPYDDGHPRHIDQVAVDFPELRIDAGLGGWPWVADMVGILRRHPNVYADTAAHRARHFATPGSGWEQLLQFGNTLLQDKIMVGLSSELIGQPKRELIAEYRQLPLKEHVKDKWLYHNARRFLGLD